MIENKVLIIEDEKMQRKLLVKLFEKEGFTVFDAPSAKGAMQLVANEGIPLVLLDIQIEDNDGSGDGLALTRQLRSAGHVGIILISQRDEDIDRVVGLEMGADAYITKPIFPREVLSISKRLLVRVEHAEQVRVCKKQVLSCDDWVLESNKRLLLHTPSGHSIKITSDECAILSEFFNSTEKILTRDHLLDEIRGGDWEANDRTIDILIARLRKKVGNIPGAFFPISSVYGKGYVIHHPDNEGN